MLGNFLIIALAAAISGTCVFLLISKAKDLGLVQVPLARSSHIKPTPTGGGIGIVIGSLLAGLALPRLDMQGLVVLALGIVMAVLGLVDDWRPLAPRIRFLTQTLVVALLLYVTGGIGTLSNGDNLAVAVMAGGVLLLGGLWWINLFNFMDGIDGIAGQQAVIMMVSAMVISATAAPEAMETWTWWMMAAVAMATSAFLAFNWPPARIFMGDAGSMFLGFVITATAIITMMADWMTLPQWLLLAVLFASDATVTLIIRFLRQQRLSQAHRSHAYQRLSRRYGGARPVSLSAASINAIVILPLALTLPEGIMGWTVVLLAYISAVALALSAGAGLPDDETAPWRAYRALVGGTR